MQENNHNLASNYGKRINSLFCSRCLSFITVTTGFFTGERLMAYVVLLRVKRQMSLLRVVVLQVFLIRS